MRAIVAVTADWGIGFRGGLLVRNPQDMRHFRKATVGGTVICGQTTFESFPHGALPNRRNIVLSTDPSFVGEERGAEVVRSIDEAIVAVASESPDSVWVIGGESVYRQLLPLCDEAWVTFHDVRLPADTWFPNLDEHPDWAFSRLADAGSTTDDGVPYEFRTYERRR